MKDKEKKEIIYLALKDLYHEFNSSINHLLIIREFLKDILNIKNDTATTYEFPSVLKYKHKN